MLAKELAVEQARLAREGSEARKRHDAAIAEVEREADEHAARLEAEIARAVVEELFPIARAFGDAPRTTAARFAETWCRLNDRAVRELGAPLQIDFIAFAFAGDQADHLTRGFGGMVVGSAASKVAKSCVEHASPVLIEDQLRTVEIAALECARENPHRDAGYLAISLSHATMRAKTIALNAFEEKRRAARLEQDKAALAPVVEEQRARGLSRIWSR
ncbi:MAG: hypothetical protein KF782_10485 [Labilithrix sp.]|nr:hypothetical protein [Labilithrix sp.]